MSSATARLNIGHQTGIILLGAVVTIAAAKVPPLPPPKKKINKFAQRLPARAICR